ncbi:LIM and calponin homology domains-containing protein 1 [Trichoplax sp. H2]|nr:LIM and calponin homology domains-containing protein 1 [Trichoplax sp. H2]|eukprot:RDD46847.1 LIM and calponin homology domains-containing protein 1 [Trichoplax sp. H2]
MPQSNFNVKYSLQPSITVVKRWIEEATLRDIPDNKIMQLLQDGILLCELLCHIKPGLITRLNTDGTEEAWLENVQNFLNGCQRLGLESWQLFSSQEIVQLAENEEYNFYDDKAIIRLKHFLSTIYYLGLNANQQRDFTGPYLDLAVMKDIIIDNDSVDAKSKFNSPETPDRQYNNSYSKKINGQQHQSLNGLPYYQSAVSPTHPPSHTNGYAKFSSEERHDDLIVLKLRGIPHDKDHFGFTVSEEYTVAGRALLIDSVSLGSRAEAEGLRIKDEIVWINGEDVLTKSIDVIHDMIAEGIRNSNLMLKIRRHQNLYGAKDFSDTESMASSVGDKLILPEENPIWNSVVQEAEEYNQELLYNGDDKQSNYSLNESEDGDAISDIETLSSHSVNKPSSPRLENRNRGFSIGLKPLKDEYNTSDHDNTDNSHDENRRSSPMSEQKPYRRSAQITSLRVSRKTEDKIDKIDDNVKDTTKFKNQSHRIRSLPRSVRGETPQPLKQDKTPERDSPKLVKDLTKNRTVSPNSESNIPKNVSQPHQKRESTNTIVSSRKSNDVVIQSRRQTPTPTRGPSPIVSQDQGHSASRRIPLRMRGTSPATVNHEERQTPNIQSNKTPARIINRTTPSKKVSSALAVRTLPVKSKTPSEPTVDPAPQVNQRSIERNSPVVENRPSPFHSRPLRSTQSRLPSRPNLQSKNITPASSANQNREANSSNNNVPAKSPITAPPTRVNRPSYGRQSPAMKSTDSEPEIPPPRKTNNSSSNKQVYPPNSLRNAIPPRRNITNQPSKGNAIPSNQPYGRTQRSETSTKNFPVRATPLNTNSSTEYNLSAAPSRNPPVADQNNRAYDSNNLYNKKVNGDHQNSNGQPNNPHGRSVLAHPVNRNTFNSRTADRNVNVPVQSLNNPSGYHPRSGFGYPVNPNANPGLTPPARRQPTTNGGFNKPTASGQGSYGNPSKLDQKSPISNSQSFNNWSSV